MISSGDVMLWQRDGMFSCDYMWVVGSWSVLLLQPMLFTVLSSFICNAEYSVGEKKVKTVSFGPVISFSGGMQIFF